MLELLSVLAIFRLGYMIQHEDGPFDMFVEFREIYFEEGDLDGRPLKSGFMQKLLSCFYCLSIWLSIPFALYFTWGNWMLFPIYWLGLSGGAVIINLIHERLKQ